MCAITYARVSHFCSCDLDLDQMTLICKPDLDILRVYLHTKMEFIGQGFEELEHEQDRQTGRQT